ncbi:MAG: SDR family oxidoreductase [Chloroflexi bacterium]|nr:SDR family oxidoreductase [Chloroflexota bacterium]
MVDRLAGKVALVTGAGSSGPGVGHGRATATLFAREGTKVVCVDRVVERAAETVAAIESEGGVAVAVAADVTKRDDCERMVAVAIERYGAIAPGQVWTPMAAAHMSPERRAERQRSGMIQDEGTAWDIAWAAVYLASDEARWVTGQVLVIDAGVTLTVRGGTTEIPARPPG